jgi:hypothetical protein
MAKELIAIDGEYYYFDDATGKLFKILLQDESDDIELLRKAVVQVIRLKEKQV